jgi:hypothetical protein
MAATFGTGLGTRPLRGLLCNHSDVLPRLAAATPDRGNTCGFRGAAGGFASVYAGARPIISRPCTARRGFAAKLRH